MKVPDNIFDFFTVFRGLCEMYADEADNPDSKSKKRGKAEKELLDFCHSYAYKINGIKKWK